MSIGEGGHRRATSRRYMLFVFLDAPRKQDLEVEAPSAEDSYDACGYPAL